MNLNQLNCLTVIPLAPTSPECSFIWKRWHKDWPIVSFLNLLAQKESLQYFFNQRINQFLLWYQTILVSSFHLQWSLWIGALILACPELSWVFTLFYFVSVFSDSKCSGILSCDYVNFVNNVHLLDVTEYVIYMV